MAAPDDRPRDAKPDAGDAGLHESAQRPTREQMAGRHNPLADRLVPRGREAPALADEGYLGNNAADLDERQEDVRRVRRGDYDPEENPPTSRLP